VSDGASPAAFEPSGSPLLAIPPFPGARLPRFAQSGPAERGDAGAWLAALVHHRVGGCYWGLEAEVTGSHHLLDGTVNPVAGAWVWSRDADPWPLLERAAQVRLPHGDSRAVLALAAGVPLTLVGPDGTERPGEADAAALIESSLAGWHWRDPFSGRSLSVAEAIALCGFWRGLIDRNRSITSVLGIADWKKPTLSPLLWGGQEVPYGAPLTARRPGGDIVALWRSRLTPAQLRDLARAEPTVLEIEDGFIRSVGLGANCVPPLSAIVDPVGIHFDPTRPSALEDMLQNGPFNPELCDRAARLRQSIVAAGLSKYGREEVRPLPRPGGARRHVLVPGQVEDDRAVTSGLALPSNLELLRRARAEAGPDAFVIYKPHPDVLAGHRRGEVGLRELAGLADRVETEAPMAGLIDMVDGLHVNTSLAGFEALLRGKPVTVWGVPFYAGWGLTTDRGAIPSRRTATRTLDELVAATLLLYPRFLDPETGLPCPPEVLVERLTEGTQRLDRRASALVAFRKVLGRVSRLFGPS
jgi:capsular polysaccharide export protein